jgi:putative cardiolipin synthase
MALSLSMQACTSTQFFSWLRVLLSVLAALFVVTGCASLPSDVKRTPSHALSDTATVGLGRLVASLKPPDADAAGHSGVLSLDDGGQAFSARMVLAGAAERSIDIQTYIWNDDDTGRLLLSEVRRAAERGVRVRLLLDDHNLSRLEPLLELLDKHPAMEVRIFNPFANRQFRLLDWLSDFSRVQRRMHNKTFVVDNQAAIVGGRNIGNAYFSVGTGLSFEDADVLFVGTAVPRVSASFDRYWNSELAYPLSALRPSGQDDDAGRLEYLDERLALVPQAGAYRDTLRRPAPLRDLLAGATALEWVSVRVFADAPEKLLYEPGRRPDLRMFQEIAAQLQGATACLDIISAYFVPGDAGTEALEALARWGVRVRVLTNSLAATDVAEAHVGYARHREALLRADVRLFELKPDFTGTPPRRLPRISGSQASLHAKAFAIDGQRVVVGSVNLDPRSMRLNTETAVLVESRVLARQLSQMLDEAVPHYAWEVKLGTDGRLEWVGAPAEATQSEPGANFLRRALVRMLSWLPIDGLL